MKLTTSYTLDVVVLYCVLAVFGFREEEKTWHVENIEIGSLTTRPWVT